MRRRQPPATMRVYTWCTHARSRRFIISLREKPVKAGTRSNYTRYHLRVQEGERGNTSLVTLIKEDKEFVDGDPSQDQVYRRSRRCWQMVDEEHHKELVSFLSCFSRLLSQQSFSCPLLFFPFV